MYPAVVARYIPGGLHRRSASIAVVLLFPQSPMQFSTAVFEVACLMTDSFRGFGAKAEGRPYCIVSGEYRGSIFVIHSVEGEQAEAEGLGA